MGLERIGRLWRIEPEFLHLTAPLTRRLAVDTHMSLLADRDFVTHQEAIDAALLQRGSGPAERRS